MAPCANDFSILDRNEMVAFSLPCQAKDVRECWRDVSFSEGHFVSLSAHSLNYVQLLTAMLRQLEGIMFNEWMQEKESTQRPHKDTL